MRIPAMAGVVVIIHEQVTLYSHVFERLEVPQGANEMFHGGRAVFFQREVKVRERMRCVLLKSLYETRKSIIAYRPAWWDQVLQVVHKTLEAFDLRKKSGETLSRDDASIKDDFGYVRFEWEVFF